MLSSNLNTFNTERVTHPCLYADPELGTRTHARHHQARHPAATTNPVPAPNRRRPWSHRTRRGADLALAIPLFLLETAWLVLDLMFDLGMEIWAAQGDKAQVNAATLAHINRLWLLLVAVLIVAVVAGLFRAPRTAIAHLLVDLLALGATVALTGTPLGGRGAPVVDLAPVSGDGMGHCVGVGRRTKCPMWVSNTLASIRNRGARTARGIALAGRPVS
ncbi:DUF6234 family protein [Streptomyces olivochromogenes]|uniref:DUF6234 family protein n=1 Tax=Streptomyces olivochromogenes TaxID=1963 RepID=UPI003695D7BF